MWQQLIKSITLTDRQLEYSIDHSVYSWFTVAYRCMVLSNSFCPPEAMVVVHIRWGTTHTTGGILIRTRCEGMWNCYCANDTLQLFCLLLSSVLLSLSLPHTLPFVQVDPVAAIICLDCHTLTSSLLVTSIVVQSKCPRWAIYLLCVLSTNWITCDSISNAHHSVNQQPHCSMYLKWQWHVEDVRMQQGKCWERWEVRG